jgi:exopolysaccharide biosynthesis polyprenyl glycosylphosphotransferase
MNVQSTMSPADSTQPRSWWHLRKPVFFVVDYGLLWLAVQAAYHWSPRVLGLWHPPGWLMVQLGLPFAIAVGLQLAGVQVNQAGFRGSETLTRILIGSVAGLLCFVLLQAVVGYELIGRYILGLTLLLGSALVLLSRFVIWRFAEKESREVFMIGGETAYGDLMRRVSEQRLPIRFVGCVRWRAMHPDWAAGPADEDTEDRRTALESQAGEFVVEKPDALSLADRQTLLLLLARGRQVIDLGYFYERELEMVHVEGLRESWFWSHDPAQARPVFFVFKRVADIGFSLLGLLLTAPLAVVCALGIVLQDRGPVFYSQTRVGLRNRPFPIHKFRTMRVNAEPGGPRWAAENDGRVTAFGRLLRRTRFDEIPQFWNILVGEMSFIGPRPERPEMIASLVEQLPYYRLRHIVKPGLTGWAQVNYHYGASLEDTREKLAYDLYYIKYGSLMREMHIILRTISTLARGR